MPHSPPAAFSFKRSLGISSALHLLLAPLFVVAAQIYLGTTVAPTPNPTEKVAVTVLTLERRPRAVSAAPSRRGPVAARAVWKAPRPTPPTVKVAALRNVLRRPIAFVAKARAVTVHRATVAFAPPRAQSRPPAEVPVAAPPATAQPVPSAEPTAADHTAAVAMAPAQVRIVDVPPGGWGQNFEKPIVADNDAIGDLRSKYHLASTVSVEVDETGRAVKVLLPPSASSDMRAELERRLLEMRYIPAECNGLRCPGTLVIDL